MVNINPINTYVYYPSLCERAPYPTHSRIYPDTYVWISE